MVNITKYIKRGIVGLSLGLLVNIPLLVELKNKHNSEDNPVVLEQTGKISTRMKAELLDEILNENNLEAYIRDYLVGRLSLERTDYLLIEPSELNSFVEYFVRIAYNRVERGGNPEEVRHFLNNARELKGFGFHIT